MQLDFSPHWKTWTGTLHEGINRISEMSINT
jgi:hypothetical protein